MYLWKGRMGVVVNRDFVGAGSWEEAESVSLGL